jgi:hypothetical protein
MEVVWRTLGREVRYLRSLERKDAALSKELG